MNERARRSARRVPPSADPRSLGIALRWIAFAVAALIFLRVLSGAQLGLAWAHVVRIGPAVLAILLPYLLIIGFDALAWRWLFAILGRDLHFLRLFGVRLATEAVLLSFPGGALLAETLKPVLLARREGVPIAETTATIAAKKVLLIGTQSLYLGAAAILGWAGLAAISQAVLGRAGLPWFVLATAGVLAVVSATMLAIFLFGGLGSRAHDLLAKLPSARLREFIGARRSGFTDTDVHLQAVLGAHLGKLAACAGPFVLSWLAETLESWTILTLLGAHLSFVQVMAFEAVVSLLRSLVFFVPAGLGVQDAGYMTALSALHRHDAALVPDPINLAAAFVLLKRAKEICWIAIGYGLLAFLRSGPTLAPSDDVPASEPREPSGNGEFSENSPIDRTRLS